MYVGECMAFQMGIPMSIQLSNLAKLPAALCTMMWFFSSVDARMVPEC